jgi:protein-disulfide isomerase
MPNHIIGSEYSTKNEGDKYEQRRFIGFKTEEEAKKYLIKQIKQRKKQIDEAYREALTKLNQPT